MDTTSRRTKELSRAIEGYEGLKALGLEGQKTSSFGFEFHPKNESSALARFLKDTAGSNDVAVALKDGIIGVSTKTNGVTDVRYFNSDGERVAAPPVFTTRLRAFQKVI